MEKTLKLHTLSSPTCPSPMLINKATSSTTTITTISFTNTVNNHVILSFNVNTHHAKTNSNTISYSSYRYNHYYNSMEDGNNEDDEDNDSGFDEAVSLFNQREYYKCHDVLEALWIKSEDPTRTLLHGILQCAVGFHHLFNKNHKGAMMELGEGLCKLRKMNFKSGPFHEFEQQISAVLDFIYQTQIELAACAEDLCLAMDRSERSYQLLGGYAAGQDLYSLQTDDIGNNVTYIQLSPPWPYVTGDPPRVKLPVLNATEQQLLAYKSW